MTLNILEEATNLVAGKRQEKYGHPSKNWGQTAQLWSDILGVEVTPQQAVMCMMAVKLAREANEPSRDNRVDIAGYALVLDMICAASSAGS